MCIPSDVITSKVKDEPSYPISRYTRFELPLEDASLLRFLAGSDSQLVTLLGNSCPSYCISLSRHIRAS